MTQSQSEAAMMWVTKEEAIDMYARFWATRHGAKASDAARERAKSLQSRGDQEGFIAWNAVADQIERHRSAKNNDKQQPSSH